MANAAGIKYVKNTIAYRGWDSDVVEVMPASQVQAFINGNYQAISALSPQMSVVEIIDEPFMDGDVLDPLTGISETRKVTLKFGVVYLDVGWPTHITRPSYSLGTTLKLRATYGGQLQPLSPRSVRPGSGPVRSPNDHNSVYVALNEYHVEWGRVVNLADLDFDGLVGTVNSDTFMGVSPGQLLCAGASLTPSFVMTPVAINGPCAWTAHVTLKQKSIYRGGSVFGWNDIYNPALQTYEPYYLTDGYLAYDTNAFAGMFS